ncbi:MAG: hypothetical protein JO097_00040 [Acidobacteriaceae bacterium]|nr:hypothetical protein [Acidobacteriaceae bacterium]MBV9296739.1 hypothetical protein [Acidobacteriaceae bacterium]MBV9767311.1 hypothetical protein [Acidobacteriaceae bacterium]
MKTRSGLITFAFAAIVLAAPSWSQSSTDQTTVAQQKTVKTKKNGRSAGGDVASGTGDIGKGAAKGAGSAAEGVGKGAVDLATLHPIDAATSVGKGGVTAGKDVAVGTTKGSAKIVKGIGRGIKHLF